LLLLINAARLAEKQRIPILFILGLTRPGLEPTTSRTAGKHANHKTTEAFENKKLCYIYLSRTMGAMVETYNK
jgi:hypothetical protein